MPFMRLVERRRALPRVCGPGGRATVWWRKRHAREGSQGTRGAHVEHVGHIRYAGRVPAGYFRVKVLQVEVEILHIGDGRDVPVSDGAVCRSGGSRVRMVGLDRRLQCVLGREGAEQRRRRQRGRRGWRRGQQG
eukprot:scaffold9927_cov59-Phaeocystis_antarctica.AAC.7